MIRFSIYGRSLILAALVLGIVGCSKVNLESGRQSVVVYTSQDRPHATPVLNRFEQDTGIHVEAVFDTEASKSLGLVNRLIGERGSPRADVFWSSETSGAILLKRKGVVAPFVSQSAGSIPGRFKDSQGYWTGFAGRARVLMYHKDRLQEPPRSARDFLRPEWAGRFALANPLFGTTATHISAVAQRLGKEKAEEFLLGLKKNRVVVTPGNANARDMVAAGELDACITDTDDAYEAISQGRRVQMVYPDQEEGGEGVLIIPNTASLIAGGPNPENARRFIDFLLSEEVEEMLAFSASANIPLRSNVKHPAHVKGLDELKLQQVDYEAVADEMEEMRRFVQESFLK